MDTQGALDSLVGRLTTILLSEAQLLGGLRGDIEFIKDEMESMNSLLLYLTEAQHRDHQVRTWMKHVTGLARDCEGNIELYVRYVAGSDGRANKGFLCFLWQFLRLLRTVPARHRVATRIRELKVRAHDVGKRRLRYGVTLPSLPNQDVAIFMDDIDLAPPSGSEDVQRRALLDVLEDPEVACVQNAIDEMIKLLLLEGAPAAQQGQSQPSLFCMVYPHSEPINTNELVLFDRSTRGMYEHPSVVASFGFKVMVDMRNHSVSKPEVQVLRDILEQVAPLLPTEHGGAGRIEAEQGTETSRGDDEDDEAMQLTKTLEGYLKGKRFLMILEHASRSDGNTLSRVLRAGAHGSPGSSVLITSALDDAPHGEFNYYPFRYKDLYDTICNISKQLMYDPPDCDVYEPMLDLCYPDLFAMKMYIRLRDVNPRRSSREMATIVETMETCKGSNKCLAKQMVRLSYNDLPARFRSCLLYLTIFPEGDPIRRTTVRRRWIAEGIIATRVINRAEDEADRCFEALLSWGLIQPREISDAGMIKTFTLHHIVHEVITRIAGDVNFVDTGLLLNLARHLSIHSRNGVQVSHADCSMEAADSNGIVAFLPFLAKSSQWQLLKLLDLEGCKGLKKHHLKSICNILLLKYLSLRNTDVKELPKQIERLQCLETLDIRQTAIRAFSTKSIMLPMLKHLLAGQAESPSNSTDRFQQSFTAVCLPSGVRGMEKLETLSHVEVSHRVNDLIDVGHLFQLRKLGVILHGKKGGLGLLFRQIEKLYGCLRSLSIHINQPPKTEGTAHAEEVVVLAKPPKFLQCLKISGITSGLLLWIAELDQLTKITLTATYLEEDYIRMLGKLKALRCLRLRRNSSAGSMLGFKEEEFKSLKSLVVNDDIITSITFEAGAAPQLEMIVWSFAKMDSLSGVLFLPKLKKLELNGDCDPDPVRRALEEHPNLPDFKHTSITDEGSS